MTWEEQAKKNIEDVVALAEQHKKYGTVPVSVSHLKDILKLVNTYEDRRAEILATHNRIPGDGNAFTSGKSIGLDMAYCIMWGIYE